MNDPNLHSSNRFTAPFQPVDLVTLSKIDTIIEWRALGMPSKYIGKARLPGDPPMRFVIREILEDGIWNYYIEREHLHHGCWGFPMRLGHPLTVLRDTLADLSERDS